MHGWPGGSAPLAQRLSHYRQTGFAAPAPEEPILNIRMRSEAAMADDLGRLPGPTVTLKTVEHAPLHLDAVCARVDRALLDNRRAETIVLAMAVGIFLLGAGAVGLSYWQQNPYFTGAALLVQGLLYLPVREILRLRRDNLVLQTLPALLGGVSQPDARLILKDALLERLWKT
jgi:hypothetical protein